MRVFLQIAYFIMGIVQLFAAWDGFMYMLGVGGFVGGILAFVVTYVPIVGSAMGMYGAMNVWGWSFLKAFVLFFWYLILWGIFLAFAGIGAIRGR
jgi:hypothetical protein